MINLHSKFPIFHIFMLFGCVWKWLVPLNPMVLLIIIPMKNGYFIGNINPTFSDKPRNHPMNEPGTSSTPWHRLALSTSSSDSSNSLGCRRWLWIWENHLILNGSFRWENVGKYGKIMGKYGKIMGKSWENMGKSWNYALKKLLCLITGVANPMFGGSFARWFKETKINIDKYAE